MQDHMGKWLQQKSKEIHEYAIEKGWWNGTRQPAELIELVHTEIAEATEELRNGRPLIYQHNFYTDTNDPRANALITPAHKDWRADLKPEGVLIEYADVAIRILDILGHEKADIEEYWPEAYASVAIERYLNELFFHMRVRRLLNQSITFGGDLSVYPLIETLALYVKYFRLMRFEVDFKDVIETKMHYNRQRPHRHGGKRF